MTKAEFICVVAILLSVTLATFVNLQLAARRARDGQRKSDLRSVSDAINKYINDFAFAPRSQNGQIMACGDTTRAKDADFTFSPCQWGKDAIVDLNDSSYPAYIARLPLDPQKSHGVDYLYISDGGQYQLYASLENSQEAEFDPKIVARNLKCGTRICNFGLASGKTRLDVSLEEMQKSK